MMVEITETDRIERDLARTRARMDGRLDELQEHLTPKQMLNDAFSYFRGGDGADFTSDLVTRVKTNPLPVALAGIGIAWLMASSQTSAATRTVARQPHDDLEARLRIAEGDVHRFDDDDEDSYASRLDDARGSVVGVVRAASDTAASFAERIKGAVASGARSAREKTHDFRADAGDAFSRIGAGASRHGVSLQEGTTTMAGTARDTLSSIAGNPFALGAIAAIVGAVAGALIPTLDQEEAALGSVATKVRTAGRDLAQDVVDRGGRVANDTLAAVKDSADAHGLTSSKPVGELLGDVKSGDLADNVKQVVQETLQSAKDSAQTHLAGSGTPAASAPDA